MKVIYFLCLLLLQSNAFSSGKITESEAVKIYNLAQKAQNEGRHKESLKGFKTVVENFPTDFQAKEKVIQELSALNMLKERDLQIKNLYNFKSSLSGKKQNNRIFFTREQFSIGNEKLIVHEYFKLVGKRAVKFSFLVLTESGDKIKYKLSLGSYNSTTEISRELGEIGKNERLYHLDGYYPGKHSTFGFFKGEPKYNLIKNNVIKIITGSIKPVSSTVYN